MAEIVLTHHKTGDSDLNFQKLLSDLQFELRRHKGLVNRIDLSENGIRVQNLKPLLDIIGSFRNEQEGLYIQKVQFVLNLSGNAIPAADLAAAIAAFDSSGVIASPYVAKIVLEGSDFTGFDLIEALYRAGRLESAEKFRISMDQLQSWWSRQNLFLQGRTESRLAALESRIDHVTALVEKIAERILSPQ